MLSPRRWWQHRRFRCHVGERLCAACGCRRDGWCRRLRRGRRAQLVIGESGFRPAGIVTWPGSVFVAERSHAAPQRAWQHARCAASLRRRRTFSVKLLRDVAGAGEVLRGFRGASSEANRVAMRNQSARSAFRWYQESLVWHGLWGSSRGGNVAAGFRTDLTSTGLSGLRTRSDGSSLPLTSRCQGRATAGGAGVSNR